jgi:sugar lactone lactonase YvrE
MRPAKELKFNAVSAWPRQPQPIIMTVAANGIAISPDQKTLYVANSESAFGWRTHRRRWYGE